MCKVSEVSRWHLINSRLNSYLVFQCFSQHVLSLFSLPQLPPTSDLLSYPECMLPHSPVLLPVSCIPFLSWWTLTFHYSGKIRHLLYQLARLHSQRFVVSSSECPQNIKYQLSFILIIGLGPSQPTLEAPWESPSSSPVLCSSDQSPVAAPGTFSWFSEMWLVVAWADFNVHFSALLECAM